MNGLDRYLTTPPDDCAFENYSESVCHALSYTFCENWEKWIEQSKVYDGWVEKLFNKGIEPTTAATIIEHTFSLYKIMYQL